MDPYETHQSAAQPDETKQGAMDRRGFLRTAGVVAVSLAVPATLWGCGKKGADSNAATGGAGPNPSEMAVQVAKLEADGLLTMDAPGKWTGKQGSHLPQVTFHEGEGAATLFTKHGMSPRHWITAHYLRDQDGKLLALQTYAGTDKEARHRFDLPKGTTRITAYSHCNVHGDWQAADTKTA